MGVRKLDATICADRTGDGQGSRARCSHGRYARGLRVPAWSPPVSRDQPTAHRTPAPRAAAPADPRRRRPARRDRRRRQRSCSPSAASAGTTMAEIARRCGLQQSSLYYYFRSKERAARRDRGARRTGRRSSSSTRVRADGGSPAVQLYRVIRADVAALCALPYDLNEIHRLAARDRDALRPVLDRAASTWSTASPAIVRRGRRARASCATVDPRLTALTLCRTTRARRTGCGSPVATAHRCRPAARSTTRSARSSPTSPCAGLLVDAARPRPRAAQRRRARRRRVGARHADPDSGWQRPVRRVETGACFERPSTETARRTVLAIRPVRRFAWALAQHARVGSGRRRLHRWSLVAAAVVATARGDRARRPRTRRSSTRSRIGYSAWPGWFPLAVADQAGIFKKDGLDVDLKYFADYIASLDAHGRGQARRQHADAQRHHGRRSPAGRSRRSSWSTTTRPATTPSSATSRSPRSPT